VGVVVPIPVAVPDRRPVSDGLPATTNRHGIDSHGSAA
jgi:hypothetical protein